MKRKLRINGHSHLLPYPEEIPQFMKDKEIFWVDDERKYMLQQGWSRPVTHSSFFLDEKLDWMEKNKIDHAVFLESINYIEHYGLKRFKTPSERIYQNLKTLKPKLSQIGYRNIELILGPLDDIGSFTI